MPDPLPRVPRFANPGSTFWRSVLPAAFHNGQTLRLARARARRGLPRSHTAIGRAMSVLIGLVRERRHHLVPAVAIEVGEFDMGAAAGPGECRRRHFLPRERSLAITQED